MAGLGDEVVTRCAACGYALTARRYAVPHECPICRAPLDAAAAPTPRGEAETRAESPPDAEASRESAPNFEPEMPSMDESEKRIEKEAEASHAPPRSSASASPPSMPNEPATRARDAHASTPPSLGSASPSLGSTSPSLDVTNTTQPSADTSPLGSVTIPMYEPDVRGGTRKTESYTPLDAGELWSEFGGGEPPHAGPPQQRVEPSPRAESKTRPETKPQPRTETEARPRAETRAAAPAQTHEPRAAPPAFATPSQPPAQVQPLRAQPAQGEFESRVSPEVVGRYIDAYRAARATVLLGAVIKIVGALLGLVVAVGPLILTIITLRQLPAAVGASLLLGLFNGVGTFATLFVVGTIVSSLGHLRVTALDSAVNTTPFLTNEQRAEVMSLR